MNFAGLQQVIQSYHLGAKLSSKDIKSIQANLSSDNQIPEIELKPIVEKIANSILKELGLPVNDSSSKLVQALVRSGDIPEGEKIEALVTEFAADDEIVLSDEEIQRILVDQNEVSTQLSHSEGDSQKSIPKIMNELKQEVLRSSLSVETKEKILETFEKRELIREPEHEVDLKAVMQGEVTMVEDFAIKDPNLKQLEEIKEVVENEMEKELASDGGLKALDVIIPMVASVEKELKTAVDELPPEIQSKTKEEPQYERKGETPVKRSVEDAIGKPKEIVVEAPVEKTVEIDDVAKAKESLQLSTVGEDASLVLPEQIKEKLTRILEAEFKPQSSDDVENRVSTESISPQLQALDFPDEMQLKVELFEKVEAVLLEKDLVIAPDDLAQEVQRFVEKIEELRSGFKSAEDAGEKEIVQSIAPQEKELLNGSDLKKEKVVYDVSSVKGFREAPEDYEKNDPVAKEIKLFIENISELLVHQNERPQILQEINDEPQVTQKAMQMAEESLTTRIGETIGKELPTLKQNLHYLSEKLSRKLASLNFDSKIFSSNAKVKQNIALPSHEKLDDIFIDPKFAKLEDVDQSEGAKRPEGLLPIKEEGVFEKNLASVVKKVPFFIEQIDSLESVLQPFLRKLGAEPLRVDEKDGDQPIAKANTPRFSAEYPGVDLNHIEEISKPHGQVLPTIHSNELNLNSNYLEVDEGFVASSKPERVPSQLDALGDAFLNSLKTVFDEVRFEKVHQEFGASFLKMKEVLNTNQVVLPQSSEDAEKIMSTLQVDAKFVSPKSAEQVKYTPEKKIGLQAKVDVARQYGSKPVLPKHFFQNSNKEILPDFDAPLDASKMPVLKKGTAFEKVVPVDVSDLMNIASSSEQAERMHLALGKLERLIHKTNQFLDKNMENDWAGFDPANIASKPLALADQVATPLSELDQLKSMLDKFDGLPSVSQKPSAPELPGSLSIADSQPSLPQGSGASESYESGEQFEQIIESFSDSIEEIKSTFASAFTSSEAPINKEISLPSLGTSQLGNTTLLDPKAMMSQALVEISAGLSGAFTDDEEMQMSLERIKQKSIEFGEQDLEVLESLQKVMDHLANKKSTPEDSVILKGVKKEVADQLLQITDLLEAIEKEFVKENSSLQILKKIHQSASHAENQIFVRHLQDNNALKVEQNQQFQVMVSKANEQLPVNVQIKKQSSYQNEETKKEYSANIQLDLSNLGVVHSRIYLAGPVKQVFLNFEDPGVKAVAESLQDELKSKLAEINFPAQVYFLSQNDNKSTLGDPSVATTSSQFSALA